MIIITGLGRCGTSFFIDVFKDCGFGVGRSLKWSPSLNAGLELAPAYAISRDMYTDYLRKDMEIDLDRKVKDQYWGRKISFREKILGLDRHTPTERNEGLVEVIKDPRVTWHPKIIRKWFEVRQDLKLIILHRKPEHIIKSREKYGLSGSGSIEKFKDPKRSKRLHQFKEDFSDFITEVLRLEIPHLLLFYPNFMFYDPLLLHSKIFNYIGVDMGSKGKNFTRIWIEKLDESKITKFED